MVFGLSLHTYTSIHVILSLIGIASGMVVLAGLLAAKGRNTWTAIFLISTALTSVTGFGFPFTKVTPGIVVGVLSGIALALAATARYLRHLAGGWRTAYVISALVSLYFNVFVLVVQSFEKVPLLRAAAPTGKEAPFTITQLVVLAAFIVLTIQAVKRFRAAAPAAVRMAA
ncbi:MAG TPA: hypothetical protein VL156_14395 [Terriglobales bacterium]|jgi:hypothetical protein|nr:hypothetical protein [Terriglobales bacterium]